VLISEKKRLNPAEDRRRAQARLSKKSIKRLGYARWLCFVHMIPIKLSARIEFSRRGCFALSRLQRATTRYILALTIVCHRQEQHKTHTSSDRPKLRTYGNPQAYIGNISNVIQLYADRLQLFCPEFCPIDRTREAIDPSA
jgi:hypothetical protein